MPKPVSGKQKKQMLREARDKKLQQRELDENPSAKPKMDSEHAFLKFVNDSDQTVTQNKADASKQFNPAEPLYKVNQVVYLSRECCPALPIRPRNVEQMDKNTYEEAEEQVFDAYFRSISPDLQTIATQYCQFELNKNVYREVWRVTERSDVVCLIVDARFPLAHCPISFLDYLKNNGKPVIILMNKVDLVSEIQQQQWTAFLVRYAASVGLRAEVVGYSALSLKDSSNRTVFLEKIVRAARNLTKKQQPELVTIGFMGQPSVGKSKTMNGLVGHQVTAVKLTAGTTKHLQTYYLNVTGENPKAQPKEAQKNEKVKIQHKYVDPKKIEKLQVLKQAETEDDDRQVKKQKMKGDDDDDLSYLSGETTRSVLLCDCPGLVLPVKNAPRPLQILTGVFPTGRVREFYSTIRLLIENSPQTLHHIIALVDKEMVMRRYDFTASFDSPAAILDALAYQHGFLNKGSTPWAHKAGLLLFRRLTEGTFHYEFAVEKMAAEKIGFDDKWIGSIRSWKGQIVEAAGEQQVNDEGEELGEQENDEVE